MSRDCFVVMGMAIALGMAGTAAAAERKPIEQLPGDVVRWSTTWMEIPNQMVQVSRDEGPVSGFLWGPAKGTALMIRSTTDALWEMVRPEQHAVPPGREQGTGALLRYEF